MRKKINVYAIIFVFLPCVMLLFGGGQCYSQLPYLNDVKVEARNFFLRAAQKALNEGRYEDAGENFNFLIDMGCNTALVNNLMEICSQYLNPMNYDE